MSSDSNDSEVNTKAASKPKSSKQLLFLVLLLGICAIVWWLNYRPSSRSVAAKLYQQGELSKVQAMFLRAPLPAKTGDSSSSESSASSKGADFQYALRSAVRLNDPDSYERLLTAARAASLAEGQLQHEQQLMQIATGQIQETPIRLLHALMDEGEDRFEAGWFVLSGALKQRNLSGAQRVVEQLKAESSEEESSELAVLEAWVDHALGKDAQAVGQLSDFLKSHPRHEFGWLLLEQIHRAFDPARAEVLLEHMTQSFPENKEVLLRHAREQRELGRPIQPTRLLEAGLDLESKDSPAFLELVQTEFDRGEYNSVLSRFAKQGRSVPSNYDELATEVFEASLARRPSEGDDSAEQLRRAALAFAMIGQPQSANEILDSLLHKVGRLRRYIDLVYKTSVFQNDPGLQAAIATVANLKEEQPKIGARVYNRPSAAIAALPGFQNYVDRCANCHGENGDGWGNAARHLFPKPRNLRDDSMRYVSGSSGLPRKEDLGRIVVQGLAGVSMPAQADLTPAEVEQIVDVVLGLRREALEEAYAQQEIKAERESWIQERWYDDVAATIPQDLEADLQAKATIAQGEELFRSAGCVNCHSEVSPILYDESGAPVAARNLVGDPLRLGESPKEIYLRIKLGMPGSPHPAYAGTESEGAALVAYVLSRRTRPPTVLGTQTNHARRLQANAIESVQE